MSAWLSLLLLLLLLLLPPPAPISAADSANSSTSAACPAHCAALGNVSFPFGARPGCGLPEFQLNCSAAAVWRPPLPQAASFLLLSISANQISSGSFLAQPLSPPNCSSLLLSSSPSSFPPSFSALPVGLNVSAAHDPSNIRLLFACNSTSVSSLAPNHSVFGFTFSSPNCLTFYSRCNSSRHAHLHPPTKTVPCFEAAAPDANSTRLKTAYGCASDVALSQIPENSTAPLAAHFYWWISQVYYDCLSCHTSQGKCRSSRNDSFLCLCSNGQYSATAACTAASPCNGVCRSSVQITLGASAIAIAVLVVGASFGIYCCRRSRSATSRLFLGQDSAVDFEKIVANQVGFCPKMTFAYEELAHATDGFSQNKMLGDGGFGTVYEGRLCNGLKVAVKRLYPENARRLEQFLNEIRVFTDLNHPNLVKFYGFCCEKYDDLLLVYECVSNGTLADNLHGDAGKGLLWETRLCIALETAQALAYLHSRAILHRDVKSTNILLDANFHAKVADFGLSRVVPITATHISTAPQGTPGYVDPDYHHCYQLTDKSDVYSFGVVLVELISGKVPVDMSRDRMEINLSSLAVAKIQTGALDELIDPFLEVSRYGTVKKMVTRVAELAFQCLAVAKDDRPQMGEVAQVLEDINEFGYGKGRSGKDMKTLGSFDVDDTSSLMNPCGTPSTSPMYVHENWKSCSNSMELKGGCKGMINSDR